METSWDLLAYPRLCGLLARKPTRLSLAMHSAGYKAASLPFVYVTFDTEDTHGALGAMRTLGARGLSLTIPHKEVAFGLVDRRTPEAEAIGAINTVVNTGRELVGTNTDWIGIKRALAEANVSLAGKTVLCFGAGGAARAALYAAKRMGAKRVLIANRTEARAAELARTFDCELLPLANLSQLRPEELDLVINSTPLGSHLAQEASPLEALFVTQVCPRAYFEMVTRETPLLESARQRGVSCIPGSRMLLFQAVEQFQLFTEASAPIGEMDRALGSEVDRALREGK